jgi:signal transduction histidine kinase
LNNVLDPFFTAKKRGAGIGLSIACTIVQAHTGRTGTEVQLEDCGGFGFRYRQVQ